MDAALNGTMEAISIVHGRIPLLIPQVNIHAEPVLRDM
jgi:hypothetical protein